MNPFILYHIEEFRLRHITPRSQITGISPKTQRPRTMEKIDTHHHMIPSIYLDRMHMPVYLSKSYPSVAFACYFPCSPDTSTRHQTATKGTRWPDFSNLVPANISRFHGPKRYFYLNSIVCSYRPHRCFPLSRNKHLCPQSPSSTPHQIRLLCYGSRYNRVISPRRTIQHQVLLRKAQS